MIIILGLVLLLAAGGVAVGGVAENGGGAHPLGEAFVIFGQSVTGLSVGQVFLFGLIAGVLAMLGLSLLLGSFNRRSASRRSRRDLLGSRRESAALREDRERLSRQLDGRQSGRDRVDRPTDAASVAGPASVPRSSFWHRISKGADR